MFWICFHRKSQQNIFYGSYYHFALRCFFHHCCLRGALRCICIKMKCLKFLIQASFSHQSTPQRCLKIWFYETILIEKHHVIMRNKTNKKSLNTKKPQKHGKIQDARLTVFVLWQRSAIKRRRNGAKGIWDTMGFPEVGLFIKFHR